MYFVNLLGASQFNQVGSFRWAPVIHKQVYVEKKNPKLRIETTSKEVEQIEEWHIKINSVSSKYNKKLAHGY